MASVFTDIELPWAGQTYVIRSHKVMGALARIEQHITLAELQAYSLKGTAPLAKLCMAYADTLRYAGARVSDDEVYAQAFEGADEQQVIMQAVMGLMRMMLPQKARARLDALMAAPDAAEGDQPEAAAVGNPPATAPASSKKPSKRRSQKGNG